MKKIVFGLTALILLCCSQGIAASSANEGGMSEPYEYVQAEIREWFSFGDSSWRISFIDTSLNGEGESILEFEDIDAPLTLFSLRGKPGLQWLTMEGTIGFGYIDSGTTIDTDHTEGWVWSRSESDTDGDIFMLEFKIYHRIYPWEEQSNSYLDGFLGYQYYREFLHIINGDTLISRHPNPDLRSGVGPIKGLSSTYEFLWESYPIGVKGNLSLEPEKKPWLYDLSFNGSTSVGLAQYRGEGVWNLRSDFEQNPSFKHEADNGISLFADLGFVYQPIRYVSLGIGYQFFLFEAWNGIDTTFFSDGTEGTTQLDEASSFRHGPYVSFSGQF